MNTKKTPSISGRRFNILSFALPVHHRPELIHIHPTWSAPVGCAWIYNHLFEITQVANQSRSLRCNTSFQVATWVHYVIILPGCGIPVASEQHLRDLWFNKGRKTLNLPAETSSAPRSGQLPAGQGRASPSMSTMERPSRSAPTAAEVI